MSMSPARDQGPLVLTAVQAENKKIIFVQKTFTGQVYREITAGLKTDGGRGVGRSTR